MDTPLERQEDRNPVTPEEHAMLDGLLFSMFKAGWNDQEIAYDLCRSNGVAERRTGQMFGPKHLVEMLRSLYYVIHDDVLKADQPDRDRGGIEQPDRTGDQPPPQGVGMAGSPPFMHPAPPSATNRLARPMDVVGSLARPEGTRSVQDPR